LTEETMMITRMNTAITVVTTLCILGCCLGCTAPEPVAPTDKLARENAYYYQKAETYFSRGCYPKAMAYFEDAHERYTAADDGAGIAHSLNGIANVYLRIGDQESALLLYDEAIAAYGRIGSTRGQIRTLCNKAAVLIAELCPGRRGFKNAGTLLLGPRHGPPGLGILQTQRQNLCPERKQRPNRTDHALDGTKRPKDLALYPAMARR